MNVTQESLESYNALDLGPLQRKVYEIIAARGPLSNRQISILLRVPVCSITGRVLELREKGAIRQFGRRVNSNGLHEKTWEVVK